MQHFWSPVALPPDSTKDGESTTSFAADLRPSPLLGILFLAVMGVALIFGSDAAPDPAQRIPLLILGLTLPIVCLLAWRHIDSLAWPAYWLPIAALAPAAYVAGAWLQMPEALLLFTVAVALATITISAAAGVWITAAVSGLLLLAPLHYPALRPVMVILSLVAGWTIFAALASAQYRARSLNRWSWAYFQNLQAAVDEARDRKAELAQALDDLAHANRQLALANERLAALRLIAEEAQKNKADFVAKVSHEFRTPLNMIIGLVDLLMETPDVYGENLPPALFEDLEIVHRNCQHLSAMINDVLDLSQVEAGRLALHRDWVNLGEVVSNAVAVVRPLTEKKALAVAVSFPEALPQVYCDRVRVQQVILNLLSNAARYTDRGGITVRIVEQDGRAVISVADSGPGIAPEDAQRIFEPFCQGTSQPWRDRGGSGLGLSISKQFVELHGGRIWIETDVGVGTTFAFSLPISPLAPPLAGPGRWISEEWHWIERPHRAAAVTANQPLRPRLVVYDESADLLPALRRQSDDIELVDAHSLAEVQARLQEYPAHALICNATSLHDLWSMLEQACHQTADTPVIGCCVPAPISQALRMGAAGYLTKPVSRADLEKVLRSTGKPVRRVLIVDDDQDVQRLWTRLLQAYDDQLEVIPASTGAQALQKLRTESPDLALLDIVLPDMDGWQVLRAKREDEAIRDIPVVVVSAQDPAQHPLLSKVVVATMGEGLSLSKLLQCSLAMSSLLLKPD